MSTTFRYSICQSFLLHKSETIDTLWGAATSCPWHVSSESWTWVEVTEKTQVFDCFLWLIPNSFKMSFNIRLLWLPIRTFLHVHVYDVTLCNENLFHYEELVKGVTMFDQTASLTWNVMICNNKQPFEPSRPLSDILVETYRLQNCSADLSRSININV